MTKNTDEPRACVCWGWLRGWWRWLLWGRASPGRPASRCRLGPAAGCWGSPQCSWWCSPEHWSMGGYSSKKSLFFLIFAITRYLRILYISSFFLQFYAKNCNKMEYLKKWDILRKYWQNNDKKLPKTVVFRENQKCCSHAHALKIPLFFLKITKKSLFFLHPITEKGRISTHAIVTLLCLYTRFNFRCGGTLISDRHVLTSASCAKGRWYFWFAMNSDHTRTEVRLIWTKQLALEVFSSDENPSSLTVVLGAHRASQSVFGINDVRVQFVVIRGVSEISRN